MIWIQNDNSTGGVASNICKTYANVFIFFWMKGFLPASPAAILRPTSATSPTTDLMTLLKVHTTRRAT